MYMHYCKREYELMKFNAAIHGVDLNSPNKKSDKSLITEEKQNNPMLFGDPEDYKKMTPEEREQATEKMKNFYQRWSGQSILNNVKLKPKRLNDG